MSRKHQDGYERRLPNRRRDFETHRCDAMPDGFSLRRYEPDDRAHQYPEPGGWVLAMRDYDWEWMTDYLNHLTPYRRQFVHFCPWCGERLG